MDRQRDLRRNTAYFLGASGTVLGALGGALSGLGILAWLVPWFAQSAPDWFFGLVVIGMLIAAIGAWPALDWLLNRQPTVGGQVLVVLGVLLIAEGLFAVVYTAWGLTGWLAIAGGALMLPAAKLALDGGGTEPLTWRSLRTARVERAEVRAQVLVAVVIGVAGVGSLLALGIVSFVNGDVLPLFGLVAVGLCGLVWHRFRW